MISYLYKNKLLTKKSINKMNKKQWINCLNFASKAAAINCNREGCNPPNINEIEKI